MDSGEYRRMVKVGPSQSGKTLEGSTIPLMYHLFEIGETVIYAVPNEDIAADKWKQDIRPAIMASRYKELLPRSGEGSKDGTPTSIMFANGATLRFMTGGGGDKSRASFTSRVLVVTETDGFDVSGVESKEGSKLAQLEARTHAFGSSARIYYECTVTTETGSTWQLYQGGTASRLVVKCCHCGEYVTPERKHLVGWQTAATDMAAERETRLVCPACGVMWDDRDRAEAHKNIRLLHRGQSIDSAGTVTGDKPDTATLGFRYTAANNMLVTLGFVGSKEWAAAKRADEDEAEREMRQFVWAEAISPDKQATSAVAVQSIIYRQSHGKRGDLPDGTRHITIGIDVGKRLCHWTAMAWSGAATPHVIDYGRIEVPVDTMADEQALLVALRDFRDVVCKQGWGGMQPRLVAVDAGYMQPVVMQFCSEAVGYMATKGVGATVHRQQYGKRITGSTVQFSTAAYSFVAIPGFAVQLCEVNADAAKTFVHSRLTTPMDRPGAMTLFRVNQPLDHLAFAKHLTAEKQVEEFVAGRGSVTTWEALNRNNHWFDSTALAGVCGLVLGEQINPPVSVPVAEKPPAKTQPRPEWMGPKPEKWI